MSESPAKKRSDISFNQEERNKVIVWLAHKIIYCQSDKKGQKTILDHISNCSDKVGEIFANSDNPVFESLRWLIFEETDIDALKFINDGFVESDLAGRLINESEISTCLNQLKDGSVDLCKHNQIFALISKCADRETIWIAHFLLSYNKCEQIISQKEKLNEVLRAWKEESPKCTWNKLKSILELLQKKRLIHDVEKILNCEGVDKVRECSRSLSSVFNRVPNYVTAVVRTDPEVFAHTCWKDVYEKINLSGENIPKQVNVVSNGKMDNFSMNFEKYADRCIEFLKEFFKLDSKINEISKEIRFPPTYMFNDEISKLADGIRVDHTVVITHYDVKEHCKSFKLNLTDISEELHVDLALVGNGDKQIILCNYKLNFVCVVHHSKASNEEEALTDLRVGDNYFRLFFYLLSHALGKDFSYISVVAAPNIKIKCENLLILNEVDIEDINDKLMNLHSEIRDIHPTSPDQKQSSLFLFIGLILAFVATTKVSPDVLFGSVHQKFLSMWLTSEQLKVVFSDKLWKIVIGGYGSGKSVVARYLLKHLMKYARPKTDIYFVMFDNSTLLVNSMLEYCNMLREDSNRNDVNVICDNGEGLGKFLSYEMKELFANLGDSINFTISNMLLALIERSKKLNRRFHLIVDEVDSELINAAEALKLKKIFLDHKDELEYTHILFLLRSMEKKRVYVSEGKSYPHNSYKCYRDCAMEVIELTRSMRTTMEIFKIINLCMEGITSPTVIPQPEPEGVKLVQHPHLLKLTDFVYEGRWECDICGITWKCLNAEIPFHCSACNFDVCRDCVNQLKATETEQQARKLTAKSISGADPIRNKPRKSSIKLKHATTESNTDESPVVELKHDNPDEIDHLAEESEKRYQGSFNVMETYYTFHKCKFLGHRVSGRQPVLIFLNLDGLEELDNSVNIALLCIALKDNCFSIPVRNSKRLIICNNVVDGELCRSALNILKKNPKRTLFYQLEHTNSTSTDQFATNEIVITNYMGSRGMECSQVTFIINPNDYFKRQYFIETISRCTDHLVLIVPYLYKTNEVAPKERETVRNMLEKLVHSDDEKLIDIRSYKIDDSLKSEDRFQIPGHQNATFTQIKINKNHETYTMFQQENEFRLPEMTKFDDSLLSNYNPPVPVTDVTVNKVSANHVEFSWDHPGNNFQIGIITKDEGSNYQSFHGFIHQKSTYKLSIDDSYTYIVIICAISKYGGLLSTPVIFSYLPHKNELRDYHDEMFDDLNLLIRHNNVSNLRSLVKYIPSIVSLKNRFNRTLLMVASSFNKPSCVEILLEEGGVDVKGADNNGYNAIHECAFNNSIDAMRVLLRSAPPEVVNRGNLFYVTPLYIASSKYHIECVKELLQYQHIDIDVKGDDGRTAYDVACIDYINYNEYTEERRKQIRELFHQYKNKHR